MTCLTMLGISRLPLMSFVIHGCLVRAALVNRYLLRIALRLIGKRSNLRNQ